MISSDKDVAFIHDTYNDDIHPDAAVGSHMIPTMDFRRHTFLDHPRCWCNPEYDEESDLYIHNSFDGREDYEEGRRLPH